MNEIVKQHNDLIDLPLNSFSASEIDLLLTICYQVQNKETTEITLDFEDIKKLADFKGKDDKKFLKKLENTNSKLMKLDFKIKKDSKTVQFVLFPTFLTDEDDKILKIKVNEPFAYLLNNLTGNYTSLELKESNKLKSVYSKKIYKKLRQFKNQEKPFWYVKIEDFRIYLDVPSSYSQSDIDKRILNKNILQELAMYFENLKIVKDYDNKTRKRGRPKVIGYKFTYKSQLKEGIKNNNVKKIAEITGWNKKPIGYCPECDKFVYEKQLKNENGEYMLFGHPDWRTGGCDWSSTYKEDIITLNDKIKEEQEKQHQEDLKKYTKEELEENKKKINTIIAKMFSKK